MARRSKMGEIKMVITKYLVVTCILKACFKKKYIYISYNHKETAHLHLFSLSFIDI